MDSKIVLMGSNTGFYLQNSQVDSTIVIPTNTPTYYTTVGLWQKDFFVIPAQKLVKVYGAIPPCVLAEDFYRRTWWEGVPAPAPDRSEIEAILPPFKMFADGIEMWGSDAGHRISTVHAGDGSIIEMLVRVNELEDYHPFVMAIVALAKKYKLVFLSAESGTVLIPDFDNLEKDMNSTKTNSDS